MSEGRLLRGHTETGADPRRDRGDLLLGRHQVTLGPGQQRVGVDLGVQGVPELGRVGAVAEPRVALRALQPVVQPGVVLDQRSPGELARLGQLVPLGGRPLQQLLDLAVQQGQSAAELQPRGLDMDPRHLAQLRASDRQLLRDPPQPRGERAGPLDRVAGVSGDQGVDRVAGQVHQGVPLVLTQLGQ